MKKYYLAYDERYKDVHDEGLLWFSRNPSIELIEWIKYYSIPISEEVCEIGCGEGRDTLYLVSDGYSITAVDASPTAIDKCKKLGEVENLKVDWIVGDALELSRKLSKRFLWIYSICTLHMLVEDIDRQKFLQSMYDLLLPGGRAMIVSMGDGVTERQSNISTAFELQDRKHMETGRILKIASTSYRGVNWDFHENELVNAGFEIEKKLETENDNYSKCMTVYLKRN